MQLLIFDSNPYLQQWVSPSSEMEESISETQCEMVNTLMDEDETLSNALTKSIIIASTIFCNIRLTTKFMNKPDKLGFARPQTSESVLTVSKSFFCLFF